MAFLVCITHLFSWKGGEVVDEQRSGRRTKSQKALGECFMPPCEWLDLLVPLSDLEQVPQLPYPSQLGNVFVVCVCVHVCVCASGCGEMSPYIKCCGWSELLGEKVSQSPCPHRKDFLTVQWKVPLFNNIIGISAFCKIQWDTLRRAILWHDKRRGSRVSSQAKPLREAGLGPSGITWVRWRHEVCHIAENTQISHGMKRPHFPYLGVSFYSFSLNYPHGCQRGRGTHLGAPGASRLPF